MSKIFTEAPIWVWPLLLLLVFVGLRARKKRSVPVVLIYALPLMGVMALRSVFALSAPTAVWAVFALAYGAGAVAGYRLQVRWILGRVGRRVKLSGEYLTLTVMMVIFWANFVGGVLGAVAPDLYQTLIFQGVFAAIVAAASGSFLGRSLRVWRASDMGVSDNVGRHRAG